MSSQTKRKLKEAKNSIEAAKEVFNEASQGDEITHEQAVQIKQVAKPELVDAQIRAIEVDAPELEERLKAAEELIEGVNGSKQTKIAESRQVGNVRIAEGALDDALDQLGEV